LKVPFAKRELAVVAGLLLGAFLVRILFFSNQGYAQVDTADFMAWFHAAADYGPGVFYAKTWCDYPPFNIYFFWIFGSLAKTLGLFGSSLLTYVMKLPANLFDSATSFLIFTFVRKRLTLKMALLATALYAFNPAVIFNAAVWGQFDAIYTFFLVLSLVLVFRSKPKLAVVAFMLGVLTKPQSIALAPLFFFFVWRKTDWKGFATSVVAATATVFAVIIPFEWTNGNPITFLSNIYFSAYNGYKYTTLNAFNLWGFGGMWVPDTLATFLLGWAMFAALATFTIYFVHKRFEVNRETLVLFGAFVLFLGFFMLPTRIHERYLFPAMAALALMFVFLKKTRPLYVVLTATCFVNQAYVLSFLNAGTFIQSGDPVVFTVSLINSAAFVYVIMLMIGELRGKKWLTPSPSPVEASAANFKEEDDA
jgi:Gpi18-like mannosyltransferase